MNNERADYVKVDLSPKNPFGLTFPAPDKNRSLFVESPSDFGKGTSKEAQDLMRTLILAHLVVRHFPKKIETNFEVGSGEFLDKLYKHYGYEKPRIIKGKDQSKPKFIEADDKKREKILYANAHSGGLDSVYRVAKLLSEDKPVLITHLRNLNPKGNFSEANASRKQAEVFKIPYEEIVLRNGTDNTGFDTMRTRDMFLALATAIVSEPYGAKKVLIEGNMKTTPDAHFSDYAPAWEFFNRLINEVGLNSQVEGVGGYEIETIGEVLALEKDLTKKFGHKVDIMSLVQNCFSAPFQIGNSRQKWERETPHIARVSPEHWCGSCPKCRRMTLGRLYYHDPRLKGISVNEVKYFVNDTYDWLKKYPHNSALITESFMQHLDRLNGVGV